MRPRRASTDFNDALARCQRCFHFGPYLLEDFEQRDGPAIPEPNPNELERRFRPIREVKEVC